MLANTLIKRLHTMVKNHGNIDVQYDEDSVVNQDVEI